jgi:hypothetical protein
MSSIPLAAGIALVLAFTSLWGWGGLARLCWRGPPLTGPLTAALGLGGVILLGGMCNLARVAYAPVLDGIGLLGLLLAAGVMGMRRTPAGPRTLSWAVAWFPGLVIVLGAWLVLHLLPQRTFNVYDDFEKYFAYPVRMLATGSVGGNRLSAMGGETLGGQAWLDGFVLAHAAPAYLGAPDTVGAFLLCVLLAGLALRRVHGAVALGAGLATVVINPQIINISTVYGGAALVMAAVFLSGVPRDDATPVPAAWFGLLYAGMISLKSTFLLFVVLQIPLVGLTQLLASGRAARPGRAAAAALGWTTLFLSPWLWLHAGRYWEASQAPRLAPAAMAPEPFGLFSTAPELYGGTQLHYTALAAVALLLAGWGAVVLFRRRADRRPALVAATAGLAAAGTTYFVLILWLAPADFGREGATRYAGPVFIGVIPAAIVLLAEATKGWRRGGWRMAPAASLVLVTMAFLPSAWARFRQIATYGSPLAFSPSISAPPFIAYNASVLAGPVRQRLAAVQQLVPAGALLATWVSTPFWLDFRRNDVRETSLAGLGTRWAWPPPARYFLWEYRGYAVRYPGFVRWTPADYAHVFLGECLMDRINSVRALAFVQYLENRAQNADILYNDGSLVLFRLR